MQNNERRYVAHELEARAAGDTMVVAGYAAVFDSLSQNLGGFVERIAPKAFAKAVKENDVRALFNHDPNIVLGRTTNGTLKLAEDSRGLHYEVDLNPKNSRHRDLYEDVQRGDVDQSSFGFSTIDDEWGFTEQDYPLRTLKSVKLYDVSPVTYPAYLDASVGARMALRSLAETTGKSLDALVEAATSNELRSVLDQEEAAEQEGQGETHPSPLVLARLALIKRQVADKRK